MGSDTSVVMVNYNGLGYLKDALRPLFNQTAGDVEVILIDNSSTDGSLEFVKTEFQREVQRDLLKIVGLDFNLGFARGANLGLGLATGRYVACLNNDVYVPLGFLEKMVEALESVSDAVAVGCILDTRGSYVRYASAFFRGRYIRGQSIQVLRRPVYCLAPCGAATLFDRDTVLRLGGYDESFYSDWEDHDLGYRINVMGHRCIHNPNVTVRHVGAGSFGRVNYDRWKRITRNKLLTYYKNCEPKNLWRAPTSLIVTALDLLRTERYSPKETLSPSRNRAALNGLYDFVRIAPSYKEIRSLIQQKRRSSDSEIYDLTSGQTEW